MSVRGSSDPPPPKAAGKTRRPSGRLPTDRQFHASSVGSGERLAILVCRLSGQAAHIRLEDVEVAPGPATLPPALDPAQAEERAADFARRVLLMAARGKRRRELGRLLRSEPCGYPYWVEHVERGRNVDFRAVDAVSGKRAGAAVRGAIARGITADS